MKRNWRNEHNKMQVTIGTGTGKGMPSVTQRFVPLFVGIAALFFIIITSSLLRMYGPDIRINLTPSMPKGFYRIDPITPSTSFHKGDIIVYPVPGHVEAIVYGRYYLKQGIPLMKPIGALARDTICIRKHQLTINQESIGKVFENDSNGESIPHKEGCYTLGRNEILPISTYYERSFDGRYHGVISKEAVIGIATPLWVFR